MNKTILISLFIPFYLTTAMAQNNNSMRMANAKEIEINVTGLPPESYRNDPYQILMAGQYLEEAPKAIDGKGVFCTLTLRNGTSMGEIYSGKVSSKQRFTLVLSSPIYFMERARYGASTFGKI